MVVWELRAIVPLPLFYGIGVLPTLTLGGAVLPMICDAGGGRCVCGARGSLSFLEVERIKLQYLKVVYIIDRNHEGILCGFCS